MTFTLPKPPSINHIYGYTSKGGYARSYVTKEGKVWFEEAGYAIKSQTRKRKPITSDLEISIYLYTARKQDVDNILKPILDLLQKQGVIENDAQIYRLLVEKFKCKVAEQRVEIELMGYEL
jgi:crossover junction endodeoxyribonuclease RusA